MRMKKILFNDKYILTQAVLDGRKTMTRRIVTDKKLHYWKCSCPDMVIVKVPESQKLKTDDNNTYFGIKDKISSEYYCDTITSPYKVGEVVAIAQGYMDVDLFHRKGKNAAYLEYLDSILPELKLSPGWGNKMFTKAALMPHHIKITGIKIERLQNISDEDCLKEGIGKYFIGFDSLHADYMGFTYSFDESGKYKYPNAKQAFATLIDKISGKGTWSSNPYVFVYEFELVD